MLQRLKTTWVALILSALFVVGSGTFIFRSFLSHVFVECRGHLREASENELTSGTIHATDSSLTDLDIRSDVDRDVFVPSGEGHKNVRIVWSRTDAPCACSDVPVPWDRSPALLRIDRDPLTGLHYVYVVRHTKHAPREPPPPLAVFRKIDDHGHRFQGEHVFEPNNLSMLIFLLSLGALAIAGARTLRASPYARRMHTWHPGAVHHDGHVVSATGASLGTMELRSRVPVGSVIVDPRAFEGHDVYRAMPIILTRRTVGVGTHQRWYEGTMRRLRDARSLAIIATMSTLFAVIAQIVAG